MKRLHRPSLSPQALALLQRRTAAVTAAPRRHAKARRLWRLQRNKAFREIRRVLQAMAPGAAHCMYCECSEATDIDHFRPLRRYPRRAFRWDNYLLACSACNSNYKRDAFPRDARGRRLLLDPTRDDPRAHLTLSPTTGIYRGQTEMGAVSIRVFGLNRSFLSTSRRGAWSAVQALIAAYADAVVRGDSRLALVLQRTLCEHPHVSVFDELLLVAGTPVAASYITPICLGALRSHPEIADWTAV